MEMLKEAIRKRKELLTRGQMRGAGKGKGMPGGLRRNKNTQPCPDDGPGYGKGGGRGKGKNRIENLKKAYDMGKEAALETLKKK